MYGSNLYTNSRGQIATPPSRLDVVYGGVVKPIKTAANLNINAYQRLTNGNKAADPAASPVGRFVNQADRLVKGALGMQQDEQRRPEDLFWQQMGEMVSTSVAGGVAAKALVPAAAFTTGAFKTLSPVAQQALRWTAGVGTESFVSTALTDNRQGSVANAFGEDAPLAVKPEDDMVSAMAKSLIPNAGAEITLGLGFLGATKAIGRGLEGFDNVRRRQSEGRATQEQTNARNFTKEAGLQDEADGDYGFTEQAKQPTPAAPAPEAAAAPAAAPAPEAAPAAPPTKQQAEDALLGPKEEPAAAPAEEEFYAPELPEVDTAVMAADRLDDEQLRATAQGTGPVLPELERQLTEQKTGFQLQEGLTPEMVAAPTDRLATPVVPYEDQWSQLPNQTLFSLASPTNNPELFDIVSKMTGRTYDEFTWTDVVDGLKVLQEQGTTIIPSRVMGSGNLVKTADVAVDAQRFQFKDNVNAEGQQKGNSLDGVEKWNTDAEGVIQTWTDPMDGKTYVVNGHNRLAKAKELGIPTLQTQPLLAQTAEQARMQGAISNIADGKGTAFDAAKIIREKGIQDAAGLDAAGIPLKQGQGEKSLGVQGLALSKLPGDLFQQAVDGALPMGRALALGGSGLDPADMIRVAGLGAKKDISERGFAELVQMASSAPKVADADQGGIPGMDTWLQDSSVIEKAELSAKVRAELISNKNLFGKVGKSKAAQALADKGGTQVNQGQVLTAADVARGVLDEFDRDKYLTGTPISELLNQGAADIAAGAKPAAIKQRILQQLEAAAEAAPPAPLEQGSTTFTTERGGSIYTVGSDGSTTRVKGASGGIHQGDVGPKPASKKTVYVSPDAANRLGGIYSKGQYAPKLTWADGKLLLNEFDISRAAATADDAAKNLPGKVESATPRTVDIPYETAPQAGLHPVEIGDGWQHIGSRIDSVTGAVPEAKSGPLPTPAEPAPLTPQQRKQLKAQVVKRAIENGEVRPSATPLPDLPDPPQNLNDPAALIADEARLAQEYGTQDVIADQLAMDARRQAMGWGDMSLDQKKANGMLDEWERPQTPAERLASSPLEERMAYLKEQRLAAEAAGDKAMAREFANAERLLARKAAAGVEPQAKPVIPITPGFTAKDRAQAKAGGAQDEGEAIAKALVRLKAADAVGNAEVADSLRTWLGRRGVEAPAPAAPAAPAQVFVLPKGLADLKPRYGYRDLNFEVGFGNDFDRAAFSLAGDAKGTSAKAAKYRQAFKEAGYDIKEVTAHGQKVKAALKKQAQAWKPDPENRSIQALELPAQAFEGGNVLSPLSDISEESKILGLDAGPLPFMDMPTTEAVKTRRILEGVVTDAVKRITGSEDVAFHGYTLQHVVPAEHGGDGVRMGFQNGFYEPMTDIVNVAGVMDSSPSRVMETGYHESFHRIQYTLLTLKDMEVFDSVFGKIRVNDLASMRSAATKATIEKQAYAFQVYAANKAAGVDVTQDGIRAEVIDALDETFPRKDGKSWEGTFRGEVAARIFQGFDKVLELIEQVNNGIRGRGFESVQGLYEKAFSGELAKTRALDYAASMSTPDQKARVAKLSEWKGDNQKAVAEISQMATSIDEQINALKSQAMAGGC
jgi:hypothetical protein